MGTLRYKDNERQALISTPFEIGSSFADLSGDILDVRDVDAIALWFVLDINSSTDVQFKVLCSDEGTQWFEIPIKTVGASKVSMENQVYEWNVDADVNMVVEIGVSDLVNYMKVQVKDAANGTGQIDEAYVSFKSKERN